jgi:replication factor A3
MSENNHRVNSKRVPQYVSRSVRIPCKILDLGNDQATVETSDGGQLSISVTQASVRISVSYVARTAA